MKIDAHQHFWNYSAAEYDWINDEMAVLKRDFLPRDLGPLLKENGVDGSIAVQARQSLEETRWLLALAGQNDFIRGVVGWVDLCSSDVTAQLDALTGQKKLVGVRHVVQGEPDDEFMLRPEFRRGIGCLKDYGLVYDLLLYPKHLPVAAKLVREFPGQRFVLDHVAKPLIADGVLEPWARDVQALARYENVTCKLSGMVTEARWRQWKPLDFRPYLEVVLEAFGPKRLMICSDWPVCTVSSDYATTLSIVRQFIAPLTAHEQSAILGETCEQIYGLR